MAVVITLLCLTSVLLAWQIAKAFTARSRRSSSPPGPIGWPIIGNLLDMPPLDAPRPWEDFSRWAKEYGDIFSIKLFGQTWVFVSSIEHAEGLLKDRSVSTSQRPNNVLLGELGGWNQAIAFTPDYHRWKRSRRMVHQYIGTNSVNARFDSNKEIEAARLMSKLLANPADVMEHLKTNAAAVILRDAYGYEVAHDGPDELIRIINIAMEHFSRFLTPPFHIVEMIPWLKYLPSWVPGNNIHELAHEISEAVENAAQKPYEYTQRLIASGSTPNSILAGLMADEGEDQDLIKWCAFAIFAGGSDTSVSTIYAFLLAMVMFPAVAQRVRAELDSVVGRDRLPKFADREALPYLDAVTKEVQRWNTVAPMVPPRITNEKMTYKDYYIPSGSIIMVNTWHIAHDEKNYKNPFDFDPTRFMGDSPERTPLETMFGFGRRRCPGRFFADSSLFIASASIAALFDIAPATDPATGKPVEVKYVPLNGTISQPQQFELSITPRDERAAELIRASVKLQ